MNDERDARDRALQAQLREAYDPVLDEPVPERLQALFRRDAPVADVVDLAGERQRRRGGWLAYGGIAASLVLGMAIGAKWLAPGSELARANHGEWVARGELAAALDAQLSGAPPTGATRIGLSFVARDGRYCRAFSQGAPRQPDSAGLACREGDDWRVTQLVAVASADGDRHPPASGASAVAEGFRTAASTWPPALLGTIDEMREGDALAADAERAAMARDWKR